MVEGSAKRRSEAVGGSFPKQTKHQPKEPLFTMTRMRMLIALLIALGLAAAAQAQTTATQPVVTGAPEGQILTAGSRSVMILDPQGKVVWEHKTGNLPHDVWMLWNGNVLYADEVSVTEVTRAHKVVFQYKPAPNKGGGAFTCQRLPGGATLVGENSTGRILEVERTGDVVFKFKAEPFAPGGHQNMRMARKLANGNYLVCLSGANMVREYTPQGKVVREFPTGTLAFSAVRTPKGTTLVGALERIVEFGEDGKVVWEFKTNEIPGVTINNITGIHVLANGNIAAGCYRAYDKEGRGVGLFEITRDKKLAWSYANPKGDHTMMPIEMLTPEGKALPGAALR